MKNQSFTKKLFFFILIISFDFVSIQAQQLPIFTQYREAQSVLNPAFVTSDYMLNGQTLSVGANYRTQFVSLKRNPKTQILRGDYVLENDYFFRPVLGGFILNDQVSTFNTTSIHGKIAALGTFDPRYGGFSMGLSAGYTRFNLNATDINWHDTGDFIAQQNFNKGYFDIGVGAFGYISLTGRNNFSFGEGGNDILYGGISIPQILSPTAKIFSNNKDIAIQRLPHAYLMAGYYKFIGRENFIEPSIWVNYIKNAPIRLNFNMRYQIKNKFWMGAGYSTSKTLHAETGYWLFDNLKMGYGFDYSLSSTASFLGLAHEVFLSFVK